MKLIAESENLQDYLVEFPPIIEFSQHEIQSLIQSIKKQNNDYKKQAELAFNWVRDEIIHSFDSKNPAVTINAKDVWHQKNGICFAKAHLLASLLRGLGIPTGFCYQRVLRISQEVNSGWALHGLNAVYFTDTGWFRLDPRGNKLGINSQFSINPEMLAYPIRENLGEIDYPTIYVRPLTAVIESMTLSTSTQDLFFNRPDRIEER